MSLVNRTTLKNYFNAGDVPTEDNFADLIDSNLNLTDGGSVAGQTVFTNTSGVSFSGSLTLLTGSAGIEHIVTTTGSADAATYTIHGKRFEVRNQLQAGISDDDTSAPFVVTNASIASDSIVVGNLSGNTNNIGGLSESVMHTVVSGSNTMKFMFTNAGGVAVADNAVFTASFVVL
tara:strand:+ start:246 stop:773 length:528 start_codon:yes stop_codon:yes gene_type:complete